VDTRQKKKGEEERMMRILFIEAGTQLWGCPQWRRTFLGKRAEIM
jgi:hypothetical protein